VPSSRPTAKATATGEIRMASPGGAAAAALRLHGRVLGGGRISVMVDKSSKDNTKLCVSGIPEGVGWQALKDFFMEAGEVKFANVNETQPQHVDLSGTCEGEVRFETAEELQAALPTLHGSTFAGSKLTVKADSNSQDGTKCIIHGIPLGTQWQELKDHCSRAGAVAFCAVKGESGSDLGEGEIRYDDPAHAVQALSLDGSVLCGAVIKVQADPSREDKLRIFGLPDRCQWQELKDHFATIGVVAFANVKPPAPAGGGSGMGEVRFDDPSLVQEAVDFLDGSELGGSVIRVRIDQSSKDGSKVFVSGLPPGVDWQTLKDHFSSVGQVAYANVNKGVGKGGPFSSMMMGSPDMGMKGMGGGMGGGMGMKGMGNMQNMNMMMTMMNQMMGMMQGKGKGW